MKNNMHWNCHGCGRPFLPNEGGPPTLSNWYLGEDNYVPAARGECPNCGIATISPTGRHPEPPHPAER